MIRFDWMSKALCARMDPDAWFNEDDAAEAKIACGWCPVRDLCKEFADTHEGTVSRKYRHGVWAGQGTSEREAHDADRTPERTRRAAALRDQILALPDLEAHVIAERFHCTKDHVWRVRRIAAQQRDMGVAA
ncbi:WhiB family transcriptional regulator [Streptomyces sp. NPDC006544]|uniref:WhiB family transcriptional regulator n=1 Tax=Streptomyces sp. NPDC006544 TaxID=3154583 RepID=UPI0033A94E37